MTIDILREEKAVCLKIQGNLDTVTAAVLKKTVQELLTEYADIYLDVQSVERFTHDGWGEIARIQKEAGGGGSCVHVMMRVPAVQTARKAEPLENLIIL